ncbi:MAG: tetratricopeptide repeat protein [Planctomycetes bacterium]|nr:tetratricopeptide repeat protein [Planctomycetota bacterium]
MAKQRADVAAASGEPVSWLRRLAPLVVLLVAFAAFAPALSQGFAALDDDYNFLYQTEWAGLEQRHLAWMWTTSWLGHWQPLSWMSLALDLERSGAPAIAGGNPQAVAAVLDQHGVAQAMHQTNLALHALGAVFLFFALRRILALAFERELGDTTIEVAALCGALLHAIHPLRVESVVWATERRDVLSGMFLLASLAAWLRARALGEALWTVVSLLLFALSLLSKAWGMTFPVVLIALELFPLRRLQRDPDKSFADLVVEKWAYFALAIGAASAAAWAQSESAAVVPWAEHGLLQRAAQAAYGLVFYLGKSLWPVDLSPMYILERDLDPTRPVYLASLAVVAVAVVGGVLAWRRWPGIVVAFALYALVVSPVLGFLQSGAQKTADRYTYLACMPLAALAAAGLVALAKRRAAAVWLGVVPLPLLFALSWQQTKIWGDPVALWERVVAVEPDNYFGQHNLAAQIRLRADRSGNPAERTPAYRRAIEHERASIAAHPFRGNEGARHDLGALHLLLGELDQAEQAWLECVEVTPDNVQCLEELRRLYLSRREVDKAKKLFDQVLVALPPNLGARKLYAELLMQQSDRAGAERVWREGVQAEPRWVEGIVGLGQLVLSQAKLGEAEALLRQAVSLDGRQVEAWVALGQALRAQRKVADAEQCWQTALMLAPGHPLATQLLQKSRQDAAAGR